MINIKSDAELNIMKKACRISAEALSLAGNLIKPGISTLEIDNIIRHYIEEKGATPSFLGYHGFPASTCISINSTVLHGIPSASKIIKDGDIVGVDVGAFYGGFHGDNAKTFACGIISSSARKIIDVTEECLRRAIEKARVGNRVGDISNAVCTYAESMACSVVRGFSGHGVGNELHEDPSVPNYGEAKRGPRLEAGMTLAIEPMINLGKSDVEVLQDGWTTVTLDKSLSAHFEHTVAITDDGPVILTICE